MLSRLVAGAELREVRRLPIGCVTHGPVDANEALQVVGWQSAKAHVRAPPAVCVVARRRAGGQALPNAFHRRNVHAVVVLDARVALNHIPVARADLARATQ